MRGEETRFGRDCFFGGVFFFEELIFFEGSFTIFFFTCAFLPALVFLDGFIVLTIFFFVGVLTGFLLDIFLLEDFLARAGLIASSS